MIELTLNQQLIGSAAIAVAILSVFIGKSKNNFSVKNYERQSLLTPREREMYKLIKDAAGSKWDVAPQVVFGAFVKVKRNPFIDRNKARLAMSSNRADFVLFDRDFNVYAVIEMDDSTHDNATQRAKDKRRDALLKAVGIKALRYRHMPTAKAIYNDLNH